MAHRETEEPSGLARFAIQEGEQVPPLSAALVEAFDAAAKLQDEELQGGDEEE
ncbi:hypothetical protein [Pseudomonas sp. USHLN015]|uniref:hypothetical protein n=1 Tax=Pseudomonas sp. USHLN015 TaxID=3081296 RepID=UPI00301E1DA8